MHFLPVVLQVDEIKATLSNDEQKLGADIIRKALAYPIRLIASNAGVNGSVVMNKVGFRGGTGTGGQRKVPAKWKYFLSASCLQRWCQRQCGCERDGLLSGRGTACLPDQVASQNCIHATVP